MKNIIHIVISENKNGYRKGKISMNEGVGIPFFEYILPFNEQMAKDKKYLLDDSAHYALSRGFTNMCEGILNELKYKFSCMSSYSELAKSFTPLDPSPSQYKALSTRMIHEINHLIRDIIALGALENVFAEYGKGDKYTYKELSYYLQRINHMSFNNIFIKEIQSDSLLGHQEVVFKPVDLKDDEDVIKVLTYVYTIIDTLLMKTLCHEMVKGKDEGIDIKNTCLALIILLKSVLLQICDLVMREEIENESKENNTSEYNNTWA